MPAGEKRQQQQWQQFGSNVSRHRERRGMSQDSLARAMSERGHDWHQSTAYKTEHAMRRADVFEARDLAEILGIPLDRLFWSDPEESAVALADSAASVLIRSWHETASAAERLLHHTDAAAHAAGQARESTFPRVREAAARLADDLAGRTLSSAIEEAFSRYERTQENP